MFSGIMPRPITDMPSVPARGQNPGPPTFDDVPLWWTASWPARGSRNPKPVPVDTLGAEAPTGRPSVNPPGIQTTRTETDAARTRLYNIYTKTKDSVKDDHDKNDKTKNKITCTLYLGVTMSGSPDLSN